MFDISYQLQIQSNYNKWIQISRNNLVLIPLSKNLLCWKPYEEERTNFIEMR